MREQLQRGLIRWMIGIGLALAASAANAQPCCECRCPGNSVPACSEDFGLDEAAYRTSVCAPLGCSIAVCTDKACAQANRCPRSESGRCADGADNDADREVDCDDPDCSGDAACLGGPSPTPPPDGTPGAGTPTPTGERDCCVGRDEGGGCDDTSCETCVCDLDDFCCIDVWDSLCAGTAGIECVDACQCGVSTTPTAASTPSISATPGPASDCCAEHDPEDGPGCSLPVCETCVCDIDDFCCADSWDQGCAEIADGSCLDDCACDIAPPLPTPTQTPTSSPTSTITKTPGDTRTPVATRTPGGCASTGECPGTLICDRTGQCVEPRSTPGGNGGGGGGGGCTMQPPTTGGHGAWLLLPGILWAIARKRRMRCVASDG
jgi:hypothetical protein